MNLEERLGDSMATQLSYEQVRSLVVEVLIGSFAGELTALVGAVAQLAEQRGLIANPNAQRNTGGYGVRVIATYDPNAGRENLAKVHSILWDLIIEGIVRPGMNDGLNNNLPFFHV